MVDYATLDDLKNHWSDFPNSKADDAESKLWEAHIEIRGLYRDIDTRVQSGDLDADVVKLVICRMVKRALQPAPQGLDGVSTVQQSQAGFTQSLTFTGEGDGTLYLKKADKRLLSGRDDGTVFSISPGGQRR